MQISLNLLKKMSRCLPFDISVQRGTNSYTKIFKKGDVLDWERVYAYEKKGITFFFVTMIDYQVYIAHLENLGDRLRDNSMPTSEAIEVLKELANLTVQELVVKTNVDERKIENAHNVVHGCIDGVSKSPKFLIRILKMMGNQKYMMKHSITVSILSVMLAKRNGVVSDNNLQIVGMGAFLHDIGVGQLTFDPEEVVELTPEQRKEMWRHPELGKQLLDGFRGVRSEVQQIVLQHHEQPNGHGYPNNLKGPEIYMPAKVVAIADSFAAMIAKRSYREAMSVMEAIQHLKQLSGKYDKKLVESFSQMILGNDTD